MPSFSTTPAYLVYSFGDGYITQPIGEFVEVGNVINPDTDEEADLVGWSDHPTGGNFVPRTSAMWLVYQDEDSGAYYHQPWQETFVSGSLVSPTSGEDMSVAGWTTVTP